MTGFQSVEDVAQKLESVDYIPSREIATVVYLATATNKPILVEGPAGAGKTELARAIARSLNLRKIRLQCYEGLDEAKALYEWEYAKQLLYTQMIKEKINDLISASSTIAEAVEKIAEQENAFFSERFLLARPLLQAITSDDPVVLLIDEIDKSDPEFEAFLLELLGDFQVSIPELGIWKANHIPIVILTSNNYRDMSDALKRRCIHLYIDYPDMDLEKRIVKLKIPGIEDRLINQLVEAIHRIRKLDLKKRPCISETIDWAKSLMVLQATDLSAEVLSDTLNVICKYQVDTKLVRASMDKVLK
ncbi:MAG: ATPase [Desulfobacterales bacterium CG23_combo_of_CG06-09_8_20_14_all_51_8]|nr:MAG: ATPase [Desulfobacterales bacterium CG23_combo_of_CG06-09_8_20_14_all_51_8]